MRAPAAPALGPLARLRARGLDAELGVSAFLLGLGVLGLGVLVLVETARIGEAVGQRGPVGPEAFPTIIGVGLLVVAGFHAIDVLRGGHGEAEAGEDIELDAPADWKTVAMLAGAFVANIVLIEPLGWPLSGAVLFWIGARALGSRTPLRDVALALAMSFGSYFLFADALGLSLPTGVLEGVL